MQTASFPVPIPTGYQVHKPTGYKASPCCSFHIFNQLGRCAVKKIIHTKYLMPLTEDNSISLNGYICNLGLDIAKHKTLVVCIISYPYN